MIALLISFIATLICITMFLGDEVMDAPSIPDDLVDKYTSILNIGVAFFMVLSILIYNLIAK